MSIDPENAPDFGDSEYPSSGERIGPAWRAAWRVLSDGAWHSRGELTPVMVEAGDVLERTTVNLLRSARRSKILESRRTTRPDGGHGFSQYRIRQ